MGAYSRGALNRSITVLAFASCIRFLRKQEIEIVILSFYHIRSKQSMIWYHHKKFIRKFSLRRSEQVILELAILMKAFLKPKYLTQRAGTCASNQFSRLLFWFYCSDFSLNISIHTSTFRVHSVLEPIIHINLRVM